MTTKSWKFKPGTYCVEMISAGVDRANEIVADKLSAGFSVGDIANDAVSSLDVLVDRNNIVECATLVFMIQNCLHRKTIMSISEAREKLWSEIEVYANACAGSATADVHDAIDDLVDSVRAQSKITHI